jgi:hypothetical protein
LAEYAPSEELTQAIVLLILIGSICVTVYFMIWPFMIHHHLVKTRRAADRLERATQTMISALRSQREAMEQVIYYQKYLADLEYRRQTRHNTDGEPPTG